MKTLSLWKKLGHLRTHQDNRGVFYFTSRVQDVRFIKVWEKENGSCTALPIVVRNGEEIVAFHAKTIKSLLAFMEGR